MIKSLDWKFFGTIIFALLLPIAVKVLRSVWIGIAAPEAYELYQSGISIVIFIEMMAAFVIIPVFSFINRHSKNPQDTKKKTIIALLATLFFCILGYGITLGAGWPLANNLESSYFNESNELIKILPNEIYNFYILLGLGGVFDVLYLVLVAYVVLNKKYRWTIVLATCKTIFFILFEFLMLNPSITQGIMGGASSISIGLTLALGPIVWFVISCFTLFINESEEWGKALKTLRLKPYKRDFRNYFKSSLFLGFETVSWNLFYYFSFTVAAWYVIPSNTPMNSQVFALANMDQVYWYIASLPITATMYVQSSALAKSESKEQDREILKASMLINCFAILISLGIVIAWTEVITPIIIRNNSELNDSIITSSQKTHKRFQ